PVAQQVPGYRGGEHRDGGAPSLGRRRVAVRDLVGGRCGSVRDITGPGITGPGITGPGITGRIVDRVGHTAELATTRPAPATSGFDYEGYVKGNYWLPLCAEVETEASGYEAAKLHRRPAADGLCPLVDPPRWCGRDHLRRVRPPRGGQQAAQRPDLRPAALRRPARYRLRGWPGGCGQLLAHFRAPLPERIRRRRRRFR